MVLLFSSYGVIYITLTETQVRFFTRIEFRIKCRILNVVVPVSVRYQDLMCLVYSCYRTGVEGLAGVYSPLTPGRNVPGSFHVSIPNDVVLYCTDNFETELLIRYKSDPVYK